MNDADINFCNLPAGRDGGMLAGGQFLREFVPGRHPLGTPGHRRAGFNTGEAYGYTAKGGTGAATRTLAQLAADAAEGRL